MQQFTSCAVLYLLLFTVGTLGRVAPEQHHSPLPRHNENSTRTADAKNELEKIEDLCVRTHNNTAFMGIEPFSRILLNSASDCRKNCLETYPKCVGVMFYYVHSGDENQKHICYLFDKNSVNEEVALVPEKPSSPLDMVRALEVVVNCHEFDPVPPLEENFVKSSDNVPLKKRDVGFDRPVIANGPWTRWSGCSNTNNVQLRTQPCEYGRFVQRRGCYPTAGGLGGSVALAGSGVPGVSGASRVSGTSGMYGTTGVSGVSGISGLYGVTGVSGVSGISGQYGVTGVSGISGGLGGLVSTGSVQPTALVSIAVPYPPSPYMHPSFQTSEYVRIMGQHQEQMQKLCCYRQQYVHQQLQNQYHPATDAEQQVHYAVPAVAACAQPCAGQYRAVSPAQIGYQLTPTLSATQYAEEVYQPPQPEQIIFTQPVQPAPGFEYEQHQLIHQPVVKTDESHYVITPSIPADHVEGDEYQPIPANQLQSYTVNQSDLHIVQPQRPVIPPLPMPDIFRPRPQPTAPIAPPVWTDWTEWSACSATCDIGSQQRNRKCESSTNAQCSGESVEWRRCVNIEPCEMWSHWTEWSSCRATCGIGERSRSRYCHIGEGHCDGSSFEAESCDTGAECAEWSHWEQWSSCSVTCGHGIKRRMRACAGGYCPGDSYQQSDCENEPCSQWANWQPWSSCSVSCGRGTKSRERLCIGSYCEGNPSEQMECNEQPCATWSEWESWSHCSATCGKGTQTRTRTCVGNYCLGKGVEQTLCEHGPCSLWSSWEDWSECSCNTGTQTRSRSCMHGRECVGEREENQRCDRRGCVQWTAWGAWSPCDKDCGPGKKTRRRECVTSEGAASNRCEGDSVDESVCNAQACCQWTAWNGWSDCDRDCGGGRITRTRMCLRPGTDESSGCYCAGYDREQISCNQHHCALIPYEPVYQQIPKLYPQPEPQPSVIGQPQPSVIGQPQPSVIGQPQPSVIGQPQPSVIGQPQTSVIGQPQPSVIGQPQPYVIGQLQPSVTGQTQPSVIGQPQPSVIGQLQPSVTGQTQPSVTGQPQPYVTGQPQPSVTGQPQPSVTGQPQPSVIGQPQPSVTGQPRPSVIGQPQPSVTGQPQRSVIAQPQPSVIGQLQPSAIGQPQPYVIGQQQPSVIGQPQPSVIRQPQPYVIVQQQPSVMVQPQPSAVVQRRVMPIPCSSCPEEQGPAMIPVQIPYYIKRVSTRPVGVRTGLACQWSEWWGWNQLSNGTLRRTRTCIGDNDCICYGAAVQQAVCSNCAENAECAEACKKK